MRGRRYRLAWAAGFYLLLSGCTPPPGPLVAPARPAPDDATILRIKTAAYDAGLEAGKRLQARHDAAQLAAAQAALAAAGTQAPAKPDCAPPPKVPAPAPHTNQAPVYVPAGPAVPVSRAD